MAKNKLKIALYWAASCGGCEIAVLDINEKILDVIQIADIVFWPVALDFKRADLEAAPDGSIAVAFINGAIRTSEQEEMAHLLRRKAGLVVAFGAGILSFLSPCVLPLVPVYISHMAGASLSPGAEVRRWPALVNSLAPVTVRLGDKLTKGLGAGGRPEIGEKAAEESEDALAEVVAASAPFAVACLAAGAAAAVAQVGFKPSAEALKPQWRRIDPLQGIKRLLGPHGLFEAAKASVKVAVVGAILAAAVVPSVPDLAAAVGMPPAALGARLVDELVDITARAVVAYLAIAAADYAWQRRQHERSLRMTRREVQDELRHYGLAPEVKQALRRRQAQLARQRMMAAVPTADVVVTNPTHVAVALRYDGSKPAPEVVAKGKGRIAQRIREIAAAHGIPIVSDPPLARSLERDVPLGQQIPAHFYQAVAEVLAFVYRQAARRRRVA
ncbi:MAG: flagellar type III secretion system protein FlhB [Thermoleophilum sp.]|nr:flagellar type III secretion system protein FlhB [Thermoleophilum sp.]